MQIMAAALALGWAPIFGHFWRAWRGRRNPISLAICATVALVVLAGAGASLSPGERSTLMLLAMSAVALGHFHWSIRSARSKFVDPRRKEPN